VVFFWHSLSPSYALGQSCFTQALIQSILIGLLPTLFARRCILARKEITCCGTKSTTDSALAKNDCGGPGSPYSNKVVTRVALTGITHRQFNCQPNIPPVL
jgi:hypothetical protein